METEQVSPLGALLVRTRKRAELTQEELAERAGVSANTISNLEAGRGHLPRQSTLDLLVSALAGALSLVPVDQAGFRAAFAEAAAAARGKRNAGAAERPDVLPPATVHAAGTATFLICVLVADAPRGQWAGQPSFDALLRQSVPPRGGTLLDPSDRLEGAMAVFADMDDALAAGCALQQALAGAAPVCLALHTGFAEPGVGDFAGPTRRRAERLVRLGQAGQLLLSQASRDLVSRALPEGVRLSEAGRQSLGVLERPQPIYQIVRAGAAPNAGLSLRLPALPPCNLPLQMTSFIGRERELVAVGRLTEQAPLVTLTGAGGCGKTRLALQVAADQLEQYAAGVRLVELAGLSGAGPGGAAVVYQAVAGALGVREAPGRPLPTTLVEALRPQRLLLLLDNCEHLIAQCAEVAAALLASCPLLQILATSREPLAIRGETAYRVPSLSLPESVAHTASTATTGNEGVRLFVERARAVLPSFELTEENAAAVTQICLRLDGIPLAIELAAAAAARLPVERIASLLEQSIGVLSGGPRDVLPRHQTLHAALDWSWTLLSEQEQMLLRRLSVFAGGWRLGAAIVICGGDGIADWAVPDLLTLLVNKSMVIEEEHEDTARLRLLETVRQHAAQRLTEAGEEDAARRRHLDWCIAFAEEAEGYLAGAEQAAWLARLEREHDNLRAALVWARERGESDRELQLAGALWRFWLNRGYVSEGRGWLEGALRHGVDAPAAVYGRVLTGAGALAGQQGDYAPAAARFEEALRLRRALGDERAVADSLSNLALLAKLRHEYERATTLHEEALAIYQEQDYAQGIARSLNGLGNIARHRGDLRRAAELYEQSLVPSRLLGDSLGMAQALGNLGNVAQIQGDRARAESLHAQALELQRALGDKIGISRTLTNMALAAYEQGDDVKTTALLAEALPLLKALGDRDILAEGLELAAHFAAARGQAGRAALVCGAAEVLRQSLGVPLPSSAQAAQDQAVRAMRAALGEEAFAAAWAEGRDLTLERAVALALADQAGGE